MFLLTTPITTPSGNSSSGFMLELTPDLYAPAAQISQPNPLDVLIPSTVPDIVDGIILVDAPEGVRVRTLTIPGGGSANGGDTYTYTLESPPPAGQFTDIDGQLQIGYLGLVPPRAIVYYLEPVVIPTDFIPPPYPEILTKFPCTGELSWTLNWEEQPQATFEFMTLASERSSVINYFSSTDRINIYGVGFAPSGQISIVEISRTKSAIPLIKVSVNLTGVHARYLDLYSFLGRQLVQPDCTAAPDARLNSPSSMTVQDLASKLGTRVVGTAIQIDPNVLASPAVPTTLGSNLDSNSIRGIGAFISYNNPNAIELVDYAASGGHTITEDLIRSDIQTSINHKIGTSYYKTYDPLTRVTFGSNPPTPPTIRPKPEWQPVPQKTTTTTEGDPDPSISPYVGTQRDPSIVFDISGKRKRRKDVKLINGQPIQEVEEEWGYVAVGKDHIVYSSGSNPGVVQINGTWRQISTKTTNYTYNELGYLISVKSTGTILTRFRVENAQKPESTTIRTNSGGGPADAIEAANLETYRFFNLNISSSETYELEPMSRYYSDIKTPKINYTICLADGSGTLDIPVDDKAYIPPYFVKTKRVVESGFASRVNPKSTALKPLPNLTTGKSTEFVERVKIEEPLKLQINTPEDPKYYTKSTDNYAAQGAQFSTTLSIADTQIVNGRPPVATNRGAILELVTPPTNPSKPTETLQPFAVKSGLSSEDLGYVTVGSLNFPTASSQEMALKAAQVDIDLINVKNAQTETMTIAWNSSIRPGDRLSYRVGGETRSRRVVSVTQTLKIEGLVDGRPMVSSDGTRVKLGVEQRTPVTVVNLPKRTTTIDL